MELRVAEIRVKKARKNVMKAYEKSVKNQIYDRPNMEHYPMTFDSSIDSMPPRVIEDEEWN